MKMVFAILAQDDSGPVCANLSQRGFYSTKLATTGGFLQSDNVTLMIGVDDDKVQLVIDIIREYSHSRTEAVPALQSSDPSRPSHVVVGGATIFVVPVDRFEKV